MSNEKKAWIDPASLPRYGDATDIAGNAPDYVKQLTSNTLGSFGMGSPDNFAYSVGRKIALVRVDLDRRDNRLEATTVGEVVVARGVYLTASYFHKSTEHSDLSVCRHVEWGRYYARRMHVLSH